MWAADGRTALLHVRPRRRGEHLERTGRIGPRGGAAQVTRFTDGRVLWPTISRDGRTIGFERDFGIWTLDTASGESRARCRSTARRARGCRRRAPAADQPVPGARAVARRPEGGVRRARRDLCASGRRRRRRRARDAHAGQRVADRVGARQPPHRLRRRSATACRRSSSTTSPPIAETQLTTGPAARPRAARSRRTASRWRSCATAGSCACSTSPAQAGAARWPRGTFSTAIAPPEPALVARRPVGRVFCMPARVCSATCRSFPRPAARAAPVSVPRQRQRQHAPWSPDGTFLLFTPASAPSGQVARVDLMLRTPRFREDQFRDLFRRDAPPSVTPAPAAPPRPRRHPRRNARLRRQRPQRPLRPPTPHPRQRPSPLPVEIVFDDIRRRLSCCRSASTSTTQSISPDGKWLLVTPTPRASRTSTSTRSTSWRASPPVARQLTSTAGARATRSSRPTAGRSST